MVVASVSGCWPFQVTTHGSSGVPQGEGVSAAGESVEAGEDGVCEEQDSEGEGDDDGDAESEGGEGSEEAVASDDVGPVVGSHGADSGSVRTVDVDEKPENGAAEADEHSEPPTTSDAEKASSNAKERPQDRHLTAAG